MLFSKEWLQSYIKETLPDNKTIVDTITFNAFEVEEVIEKGDDTLFDLKVLPNRAHDALAHRGVAKELTSLLSLTFVDTEEYYKGEGDTSVSVPTVLSEDSKACPLFYSVRIEGVKIKESPEYIRKRLEAIGQRSINNIVDITNYVQFAINKPMHAYDADFVKGGTLIARFAKEGETLTTLDDKELALDTKTLVIADSEKPLGLAGIKGGKYSGVSTETTSLILESANFSPSLVRKTAQKYGIRTDASKRFENEISNSLVEEGLRMTIALICKECPNAKVSVVTHAGEESTWVYETAFTTGEVNRLLGTNYSKEDIEKTLQNIGFSYTITTLKERITERLKSVEGSTYKNPSSMRSDAPKDFSCSSLVSYLMNGVWQPSISIDKYVFGQKINANDLQFGDLVFSNSGEGRIYIESVGFLPGTRVEEGVDHVGLYVGDGKVAHSSRKNNGFKIEALDGSESFSSGLLYGRIANAEDEYFFVEAPKERLDIRIKEDVIEEIARTRGLATIKGILPPLGNKKGSQHKRLYYETKIKNILFGHGFSEMYTYTFGNEGEVTIMKALMDKKKLRSTLSKGVVEAFKMNYLNAPLLGVKEIRVFEFGNVFSKTKERRMFSFAIDDGAKKSSFSDVADIILAEIKEALEVADLPYEVVSTKPYTVEVDLDSLLEILPEKEGSVLLDVEVKERGMNAQFSSISLYPFIVRDIAVWVPETMSLENLKQGIEDSLANYSHLLARKVELFDSFTKDGKTSYAFRIIIQSHEKTLTDEEANAVANKVYDYLKKEGYEIR